MTRVPQSKLTPTQRRNRVLMAMEDGEWRTPTIAAWADLSDQQTRADLGWLERNGFAETGETDDGRWWDTTAKADEYLAGLTTEERDW